MEQEQVLRKVRKLLRLGDSPNVNEAALAMKRAHELMEKHSIEQAMLAVEDGDEQGSIEEEEIRTWNDPLFSSGRLNGIIPSWKANLGHVIAVYHGARVYSQGARIMLVGQASAVQTVRYLFDFCVSEIDRLAKRECSGEGRVYFNNFRRGAVYAINESLTAARNAARDEMRRSAGAGTALVRVNNAIAKVDRRGEAVAQWMKQNMSLRTSKSYSTAQQDAGAFAHGRHCGKGINVSSPSRRIGRGPNGRLTG